ncbi:MAG TPA: hypothetical protein VLC93_11790, partial [Myxococcota bacterium]|nr:hypothetical protein [Myxococcota bacterium]
MRLTIVAAAIAFLSVACSSDPEPIDPASVQIFTGYCTGTLLAEHAAMRWIGQSQWSGSERIPAGTKFLLSESFDKPFGYVVYDDDSLRRLD